MTDAPATHVDARLDEASLAQFTFKGDTVRAVGCAVARAFLAAPGSLVWADEVPLPELDADDKNVVGLVFRNLARWGMVVRLEGATDHRRSRRQSRKGGVAWRYRLENRGLLETFLRRNGQPPPARTGQQELF